MSDDNKEAPEVEVEKEAEVEKETDEEVTDLTNRYEPVLLWWF